ncbi:hypothetical protein [Prosthecobacter sp.]|uniref:hypothetical protein n=1 Tax=Prosthecobacter sp. TaxID=1965333 RepID=UPI00378329D3
MHTNAAAKLTVSLVFVCLLMAILNYELVRKRFPSLLPNVVLTTCIRSFDRQGPGVEVHLGTPRIRLTLEMKTVIAHGDEAIPYLLDAVASRKPARAGVAAFCLTHLQYKRAATQVSDQLRYFSAQPESDLNEFALTALREYLRCNPRLSAVTPAIAPESLSPSPP